MGFLSHLFKHREAGDASPVGEGCAGKTGILPQIAGIMRLELGDVLPRVPEQFVRAGEHDLRQKLSFDAQTVAPSMARGRVEVPLPVISEQCPSVFFLSAHAANEVLIRLPLQKLVEQLGMPQQPLEPPASVPEPRSHLPEPPASMPEPPDSVPEPPASVPEPPASMPEPPDSVPEPPASVPEPPASVPEPPAPLPEPPVPWETSPSAEVATPEQTPLPSPKAPLPLDGYLGEDAHFQVTVAASVDIPFLASLRPAVLGATIPAPEIPAAHAAPPEGSVAVRPLGVQPPPVKPIIFPPRIASPVSQIAPAAPATPLPVAQSVVRKSGERFAALQPIFMTDETLDLSAIARHCAALPGVRACVLRVGADEEKSGEFSDGDDTISHFQTIRAGDVILRVLLSPRGFIPGVRERLAQAVETIAIS